MNDIEAAQGYVVVKSTNIVEPNKSFEVIHKPTIFYEIVSSGDERYKTGQWVLTANIHYQFTDGSIDYRVIRADDIIGTKKNV